MADKNTNLYAFESDLMFSSVMLNEDACINLLQAIFPDKEIERIEYLNPFNPRSENIELEIQKYIQHNPPGKSIRLDVYFKNSSTVYNVEMERLNKGKARTIRRARMYSSLIDANLLNKGTSYKDLIESYVIFICKFDPFDRKKCIYKFSSRCEDENDLYENNGRYNIYLNTKGKDSNIGFDLKEMFKYINGGTDTIGMETKSKLVRTIDKYVQEFNSTDTWRKGAMTLDMLIQENCEEAREEGMAKGLAEGRAKGIAEGRAEGKAEGIAEGKAEGKAEGRAEGKAEAETQTVKNMYADHVPIDKIVQYVSLSADEVKSIISEK